MQRGPIYDIKTGSYYVGSRALFGFSDLASLYMQIRASTM